MAERHSESRDATRQRHEKVLALLQAGTGRVEDLADLLDVSPSTVRRDLARLTRSGQIARTYGGAITRNTFHERSVGDSAHVARHAKASIAEQAARLVAEEATIFLDAGTTCAALAAVLTVRKRLTVVTRGLEVALELASAPGVEVIIVGGRVRELSHATVGPLAEIALRRFTFDVVFLGADAVDPMRGIGEPTVEETMLKELAAAQGRQVVVLADASKFRGEPPPAWTRLPGLWSVITDSGVDEETLAAFAENRVSVTVA